MEIVNAGTHPLQFKAMQRITKAVELDDLQPVDDMVKHSSSAVDIRTVLLQGCIHTSIIAV